MGPHPGWAVTGMLVACLGTAPAAAQQLVLVDSVRVRLAGRLHVQFSTTSVDSAAGEAVPASEFIVRRARLTFDVTLNDLVSVRIEPDFSTSASGGRLALKDAFIRLTFHPAVRATLGHFKRPFDLFQLTSTTQLVVAERGGQVRGVTACGPLRTVCSYSNLAVGLLYADRDVGLLLDGDVVPRRVRYTAALTNGEAALARETTTGKQITGRISIVPADGLTLSANATSRDYAHPATGAPRHAVGWGGDLELGDYAEGAHVQAGVVGGDNWQVPRPAPEDTTDVATFLAAQVLAAYRWPVAGRWISGLEPLARASWADPNRTVARDEGWLLTSGLIVHLRSRNMLLVNLEAWLPKAGATEYALVSQLSVNF